jgi:hypothetical protein
MGTPESLGLKGEALDLALLDARLATLMASLSAAIL